MIPRLAPFYLLAVFALAACADSNDNDSEDVSGQRDVTTSDAGDVDAQDASAADVPVDDAGQDAEPDDTAPTDVGVDDADPADVAPDAADSSDATDATVDAPQDTADADVADTADAESDAAADADTADGTDTTDASEDVADVTDTGEVNRCEANPCTATDPLVECWDDSTVSHCNFDATEGCFYRTFEDCSASGRVCQDAFGVTCVPAG